MKDLTTNLSNKVKPAQTVSSSDNIQFQLNEDNQLKNIHTILDLLKSDLMEHFKLEKSDDQENPSSIVCTMCLSFLGQPKSNNKSSKYFTSRQNIKVPPILLADIIDKEELVKQKEKFRTLKFQIKRHLDCPTHKRALESDYDRKVEGKVGARNEKVGLLCARTVYNNVFEARSQYSYERDIAHLNNHADVGSQNHSRKFAAAFVKTVSGLLTSQIATLVNTDLPCMGGRPRPISIVGDKGTMKGITLHPLGFDTILISNGYLKAEFFAGCPIVEVWKGKGLAKGIIEAMSVYTLTREHLPNSIAGATYDGEYLLKNVPEELGNELNLEGKAKENFISRNIWDPAHRLELAEEHARKNAKLINKHHTIVHQQIKHFRAGKQRISLKKEAENLNMKSREPRQSSDTRFISHEHKVICNQFCNWNIQYSYWEKKAREQIEDPSEEITSSEITEAQNMAADLRNVTNITVFLTMLELTDLLTRTSCQLQSSDRFPWEFIEIIKQLLKKLDYVKECFDQGLIPDITHESYGKDKDVYCKNNVGKPQWNVMKTNLPNNQRSTFLTIPVTLTGEFENRHMRRYLTKNQVKTSIDEEVKAAMKEISKTYIAALIKYINGYFINGNNPSRINTKEPLWIKLAKDSFDFTTSISKEQRSKSFTNLMATTMIQPYTEKEIEVATFQYQILLERVKTLIEEDSKNSSPQPLKTIIYRLCSTKNLYKQCELAITIMLFNLGCSTSECGMESLISSLGETNSKDRPISIETLQNEMMIRKKCSPPSPSFYKELTPKCLEHLFWWWP